MRLDIYLNNEFNTGREKAKELIKSGKVLVDNVIIKKPSFEIIDQKVSITKDDYNKYVSRGAYKLLQAIDEFDIDINLKKCLDIGASTGGFSNVLIEHNAKSILAVDTGTDQLHEKIKNSKIVTSLENTNILNISSNEYGKFDIICVDVSFVSIKKLIPHIKTLASDVCTFIFLVKPQFEVGKSKLNKKGVVKNIKDREKALEEVCSLCNVLDFKNIKTTVSNTVGHGGNIEYLLVCDRGYNENRNLSK